MSRFEMVTELNAPAAEVYQWHMRPGAFERLRPPWKRIELVGDAETPRVGSRVELKIGRPPLAIRWLARHVAVEPETGFEDVQERGPFRSWHHRHRFEPTGAASCLLRDTIDYEIPGGRLGRWLIGSGIETDLVRTFRYRHQTTVDDVRALRDNAPEEPRRVAVSGATGLIGEAAIAMLQTAGHEVVRLVRSIAARKSPQDVLWDPLRGVTEPEKLEGLYGVLHLAGESISQGRWTEAKKARIRQSRVVGTCSLVDSLGRLAKPPEVLVSASGIGFYGDRQDEILDESSAPGRGYLTRVAEEWEEAALTARSWARRVAVARIGVVLSPQGGALSKMLPAFRLGGGGRIGDGCQYMSWISIDDAGGALLHLLTRSTLEGPVNLVSPHPVRNSEFARCLGQVLRRPTLLPMPAVAVRVLFGEMGESILLSGSYVKPQRLLDSGYRFRQPELSRALGHLLGSKSEP